MASESLFRRVSTVLSMCQFMVRGWPRMRTWAEQNRFSNSLELLVKGGLHVASFGADIVGLRRDPLTGGPLKPGYYSTGTAQSKPAKVLSAEPAAVARKLRTSGSRGNSGAHNETWGAAATGEGSLDAERGGVVLHASLGHPKKWDTGLTWSIYN